MTAYTLNTDFFRKHLAQAVLTVLALSGVAAVFLPFVDTYVPLGVVLDPPGEDLPFRVFVGPFVVLPFFIFTGYLRWLLTGGLSRWESGVGYALALMVVVLFLLFLLLGLWESSLRVRDLASFTSHAVALAAGVWFVIQNVRHGTSPTLTALVAMQLAYLPFALFWLAGIWVSKLLGDLASITDMSIGAALTFLTVFVYTAQAALSAQGQPRLWLRVLPLGLVWAGGLAAGFTLN